MSRFNTKAYIGDGVFADIRDGDLVLTTEDGLRETNLIVLEPDVVKSLLDYVREKMAL